MGGEAATVGDVGQKFVGMLVDEGDGIAHAVLADHVVEGLVAAATNHFGEVLGVGAEVLDERVDGDVRLGEDVVLGEQLLEAARQFVVLGIAQKMDTFAVSLRQFRKDIIFFIIIFSVVIIVVIIIFFFSIIVVIILRFF